MIGSLRRLVLPAAAALLVAVLAGACSTSSAASSQTSGGKLTLVAYSTPAKAYAKLIAAFQKTAAGKGVVFTTSFGPSGDQSRAVTSGLPADVVAFSLTPDMTRLVKAHLVASNWASTEPYHGIVTNSVVVIAVRKGNPKHITGWADLTKPGIQVITPNPFSSGSARWNIMAAYGYASDKGANPAAGISYLTALFHNVVAQPSSGRNAMETFVAGKGDAVLAYENEAISAEKAGDAIQYIVPPQTILIQTPVAVTSDSSNAKVAKDFLDFLWTTKAQEIWAKSGYRPVVPSVAAMYAFPQPADLFTIADLGGWTTVTKKFFDPTNGVVTSIERSIGASVGSS